MTLSYQQKEFDQSAHIELRLGNIGKLKGAAALIDIEDFDRVSNFKWIAMQSKDRIYVCSLIYIGKKQYSTLWLHRFLMNCPANMVVDHINGDCLDNRKINLRICSQHQNLFNSNPKRKYKKYKGVYFHADGRPNPWESYITLNTKKRNLRYYKTEIDAATAYNKAAIKLFGEFAKVNIL